MIIVTILFLTNFIPGTWLSGWDTLHPEFNWPLYFQRTIFASWQETYGLGAVSIQAYASEFSRLLILFPLSISLPQESLRYLYLLITLIAGSLGAFLYLKTLLLKNVSSFLGALAFLLNLGTLQIFSLPFEMNITHFATYPWILLFVSKYINNNSKRNLLLLGIAAFFTSSIAHTPTLFFVFLFMVSVYAIIFNVLNHGRLKNIIVILAVIFVTNAFWLLPSGYTFLFHKNIVSGSKVSQQFSEDLILNEQKVGTIENTILLKNIFFDWGKFSNSDRSFVQLLEKWQDHENNNITKLIGYCLFVLILVGVFISIRRNRLFLALLPTLIIGFIFLANGEAFFQNTLFALINKQPILRESLRFTLTKFMVITAFAYAGFFAMAMNSILNKFSKKIYSLAILVLVTTSLIFYMLPAFRGDFINDKVRVSFPKEYFLTSEWLNKQKGLGRTAIFPEESYWAWHYYNWNYEGAGFWWFLLNKPILDREMGRWMPQNENYYWEVSYALYSKNLPLLEKVLEKYDVSWLLVDKNIISPTSPKSLFFDELKELIGESQKIKFIKSFGNIDIYDFKSSNDFVYILRNPPSVNNYKWGNLDQAYVDFGPYITTANPQVTYPYRTLFTGKDQKDLEFKINPSTLKDPIFQTKELTSWLPQLEHKKSYLIEITAKNTSGKSLLFWIENLTNRKADLETYLPKDKEGGTYYFVQPPMALDGLGYTLHLDNISIGNTIAKNEVTQIKVYEFPYSNLISRHNANPKPAEIMPVVSIDHPNPAFYKIELNNVFDKDVLVLSQSFDEGWLGFGNHVLVSNWANGWQLTGKEKTVYLFYWPQALEFLGFAIFAVSTIWYIIYLRHGGVCRTV